MGRYNNFLRYKGTCIMYIMSPVNRSPCLSVSPAEPVIEKALAAAPEDAILVHVAVGPRDL